MQNIFLKRAQSIGRGIEQEVQAIAEGKNVTSLGLANKVEELLSLIGSAHLNGCHLEGAKKSLLGETAKNLQVLSQKHREIPGLFSLCQKVNKVLPSSMQSIDMTFSCAEFFGEKGFEVIQLVEEIDRHLEKEALAAFALDLLSIGKKEEEVLAALVVYQGLDASEKKSVWEVLSCVITPDVSTQEIIQWIGCLSGLEREKLHKLGDVVVRLTTQARGYARENGKVIEKVKRLSKKELEEAFSLSIPKEIQSVKNPDMKAAIFCRYIKTPVEKRKDFLTEVDNLLIRVALSQKHPYTSSDCFEALYSKFPEDKKKEVLELIIGLLGEGISIEYSLTCISALEGFISDKKGRAIDMVFLIAKKNIEDPKKALSLGYKFLFSQFSLKMLPVLFDVLQKDPQVADLRVEDIIPKIKQELFSSIKALLEKLDTKPQDLDVFKEWISVIEENSNKLNITIGDELYWIKEAINNWLKRKADNVITIHRNLVKKIHEPIVESVSTILIGAEEESFVFAHLQLLAHKQVVEQTYKDLPAIDKMIFHKVLNGVRKRLQEASESEKEKLKSALQDYCSDFESFAKNLEDSHHRIPQILAQTGKPEERVPFVVSQLYEIAAIIESSPSSREEGEVFSLQEHRTFSLARSTYHCSVGQEEGIAQFYKEITKPQKIVQYESVEDGEFASLIQEGLSKAVSAAEDLLSSENDFTKKIVGNQNSLDQLVHQSLYLKNLLHKELQLSHTLSLDLYGHVIDNRLQTLKKEKVLRAFYQEAIKIVFSSLREFFSKAFAGAKGLLFYNRLISFLDKEKPQEVVRFNEELDPIGVTDYGVQKVLEKLKILRSLDSNKGFL